MHTICPWCDAESSWDEEIGAEEHCPYCLNELGDYRSLSIASDDIDERGAEIEHRANATTDVGAGDISFHEYTKALLAEQTNWHICQECDEPMIHIGQQIMTGPLMQVRVWQGTPVLPLPITTDMFVCPSCNRLEQLLSSKDAQTWSKR